MLDNTDVEAAQTTDTAATHSCDLVLLLFIDLLALIAQVNERVAGITSIGTVRETQQDRVRPFLQKLMTMWNAL